MGATPADTQREITSLRTDLSAAVEELQRRMGGGPKGIARSGGRRPATAARAGAPAEGPTLSERAAEVAERAREHSAALSVGGLLALGVVGYGLFALYQAWRERRTPRSRLKQRVQRTREDLGSLLDDSRRRVRETRKRGLLLKVEDGPRGGSGYMRVTGARLDPPKTEKGSRISVLKNLLWAAMLSVFMAVSSVVARRLAGSVWRTTIREVPPTEKK